MTDDVPPGLPHTLANLRDLRNIQMTEEKGKSPRPQSGRGLIGASGDAPGLAAVGAGLDQDAYEAAFLAALGDELMASLLCPVEDIVDVQGIVEDGFDEGITVAVNLAAKGGDDAGAVLAAPIDDGPSAGIRAVGSGGDPVAVTVAVGAGVYDAGLCGGRARA